MRQFNRFWRTLSVTSLLLEIFRRIYAISISLYTPSAMYASFIVERSSPVRRMRPFARFWRKLCVISLLLEIFRRLNAILIAFYTAIATYAVVSVETSLTVRKMRTYTRSCRKQSVISLLLEIFRRLHAISIIFYFPKAMYASCIVEWSRPVRKMRPFARFWENWALFRLCWRYFDV